jgi:predicted Fe-S protein YdhL (DUF1289 family)
MSWSWRTWALAAALLSTRLWLLDSLLAQGVTNPPAPSSSNSAVPAPPVSELAPPLDLPPVPLGERSPITFFRELLAMNEDERDQALIQFPPDRRAQILAKVGEYEALPPEERELRLRVTELSWYLRPLMTMPAAYRNEQLSMIPEPNRSLLARRLSKWDNVPVKAQRDLLGLEPTLLYIADIGGRSKSERRQILSSMTPERRRLLEKGLEKWDSMSEAQRQSTLSRFNQFFKLTGAEQEKTLKTLSEPERQQIEKTLQTFGHLTEDQRAWCMRSFEKFANLSLAERQEFLKNADRWKLMSPSEREAWRQLVNYVPPPLPFLPPPLPQGPPTATETTNRN